MEELRIGAYICHCGTNIAGTVDVKEVAEFASNLDGVVISKDVTYACSDPIQREIEQDIKGKKLNRVVIAACSPRIHEETFRNVLIRAGLNKYLLEMVNIREHDSWVHDDKDQATEKAKDLVSMAVNRALLLKAYQDTEIKVGESALIVGGGIAGIQASLDLADAGYQVFLVEEEPFLGGRMAQLGLTFPTLDCSTCILAPKMSEVGRHPNIEILANSEVEKVEGYVGNFSVTIKQKARFVTGDCTSCDKCTEVCPVAVPDEFNMGLSERKAIYKTFPQAVPAEYAIDSEACAGCEKCMEVCEPGAINFNVPRESTRKLQVDTAIITTGADPYDPTPLAEYGYNRYHNVITTMDFERMYAPTSPTGGQVVKPSGHETPKRIAFVQCVGSRTTNIALKEHPYCSRICCMVSIKQALVLKSKIPDAQVTVYYIDIRSYGKGYEELYHRAREQGVRFIRGLPAEILENGDKSLTLIGENIFLGEMYERNHDLVILSVGLEAREGSAQVQKIFGLDRDPDGLFIEKHSKLEPVDTTTAGILLAGTAAGPKDIRESSTQAKAAASRASRLMKTGKIKIEALTAIVDEELCNGCKICEEICPYGAISVDRVARVTGSLCQGCGTCTVSCPVNAIDISRYSDEQIMAQINAALAEKPGKKVIVFSSYWCSYSGADMAGTARIKHSPNARIIRLPCTGRVKPSFVLQALRKGAGGVLIAACHPGECHYKTGEQETSKRYKIIQEVLQEEGVDGSRVFMERVSAAEGKRFAEVVNQIVSKVTELESIPEKKLQMASQRLDEKLFSPGGDHRST